MRISDWSSDVCSSDLLLRLSYGGREIYTKWARRAQQLWEARQEEFGRRMFYNNGSLRVMAADALAEQRAIFDRQIGRASCRERVCQYVEISVVAVSLKKKTNTKYC